MLAHNYPDGEDKIQLNTGSNYAYSMRANTLLTGFLFRQIFILLLFTSKDFSETVFTVDEKTMSYQTHNQTTEIKEAIHIIVTFSLQCKSCVPNPVVTLGASL